MGNVATKSMTDAEAVQRTMETLSKTISEFREAEMRRKLKDCQRVRVMSYQHQGPYLEGDKVWYQQHDGNAWYGSASVLCQRDNSVWINSYMLLVL